MDFCGCSEQGIRDGHLCRWAKRTVSYAVQSVPMQFQVSTIESLMRSIADDWSRWGLRLVPARGTPDILIRRQRLDGPAGTLADAQLPCGPVDSQLLVRLDNSESWTLAANPPQGKIDIRAVLSHEIGHTLGLGHSNDPNALMRPTYRPGLRKPQADEARHMLNRYGDSDSRGDDMGEGRCLQLLTRILSNEKILDCLLDGLINGSDEQIEQFETVLLKMADRYEQREAQTKAA